MSKKTGTKGMPEAAKNPSKIELQKTVIEMAKLLNGIGFRTLMFRDVLVEATKKLHEAGRLKPEDAMVLDIQIRTADAILKSCFQMPPNRTEKYRKMRNVEDFNKEVEAMMDTISPIIVSPEGVIIKPGRGETH